MSIPAIEMFAIAVEHLRACEGVSFSTPILYSRGGTVVAIEFESSMTILNITNTDFHGSKRPEINFKISIPRNEGKDSWIARAEKIWEAF